MKGILADNNADAHLERLVVNWTAPFWLEVWASLQLTVSTFGRLGLDRQLPDDQLWHLCQQYEYVLLTGNRNGDGPDSLEVTLRTQNHAACLPVVTLADADRVLNDSAYAKRTAEKMLAYLLFIDDVRGTGRLYVP